MKYPDYYWYEFRAVGEKRRNLVPHKFIQEQLDDLGSRPENVHISIFRYSDKIKRYRDENQNRTSGFRGPCYADYLPIDVDLDIEDSIAPSVDATRKIVLFLKEQWELDFKQYACYFTGGRGFHFHIPIEIFGDIPPNRRYPDILYELLIEIFKQGDGEIIRPLRNGENDNIYTSDIVDFAPYSPLHMLRMPNTIHEDTQRWKIPIRFNELMDGSVDDAAQRIWGAASQSRPPYKPPREKKTLIEVGDRIRERINGEGLRHRKDYEAVGKLNSQPRMTTADIENMERAGFGRFARNARKAMQVLGAGLEESESVADLGGRHDALCFLVGKLKERWGLPKDWTTALLHHWNQANEDPLPDREFQNVIDSIYRS